MGDNRVNQLHNPNQNVIAASMVTAIGNLEEE